MDDPTTPALPAVTAPNEIAVEVLDPANHEQLRDLRCVYHPEFGAAESIRVEHESYMDAAIRFGRAIPNTEVQVSFCCGCIRVEHRRMTLTEYFT